MLLKAEMAELLLLPPVRSPMPSSIPATRVFTRSDVRRLLDLDACIGAVAAAFRAQAYGSAIAPGVLGTHVRDGGFHVKTAGLLSPHARYVAKINANFPDNPGRHSLPTIQGVVALYDADDGRLLALMDSGELTAIRTAAATALAASHLAREDSSTIAILGCGLQGRHQLRALRRVLPLRRVLASDENNEAASRYAAKLAADDGIEVLAIARDRGALRQADVIVTCTPSRTPILSWADVAPGTFVAGVGADSEDKSELAPDLMAGSTVVTDVLAQCATIGDLHHAIGAGAMRLEDVHAELADVVSGRRSGRTSREEVTVFDSTGTALEDVAAAVVVYERGMAEGTGLEVQLGS